MLKYTNWKDGCVRVYDGSAWITVTADGRVVDQNKPIPGFVCETFSKSKLAEAIETVKNLKKAPFESAYLRFNNLPASGCSKNFATGTMEKGTSCYSLTWDLVNGCYTISGNALEGAMISYILQRAPIYFIAGEEVGTGSDGEPLLKDPKILGNAQFDLDKNGYILKEEH